jgi:hypothetical protein
MGVIFNDGIVYFAVTSYVLFCEEQIGTLYHVQYHRSSGIQNYW